MGSKNKKQRKGGTGEGSGGAVAAENGEQMITDPRFASAHTDPRFRTVPRRESKVAIDSRFQRVFTDKRFTTGSAPVDKRGKRRRGGSGKDSLREFYRIDEEEEKKQKKKRKGREDRDGDSEEMSGKESDIEKEDAGVKPEGKLDSSEEESSGAESEEETKIEKKLSLKSRHKLDSLDEESDEEDNEVESEEVSEEEVEVDTDEDGEDIFEDGPELVEENIPDIDKETHRLAIVNMDWRHVSAKDLYVVLNSFLPKEGRIVSVAVYPSEFGVERMKEEEIHGPKIDGDEKNEDDDEEEEEDEDVINQKLRAYEISRLRYYYAVVECDSVPTADYLYKSCDGIEFERSSNKLDLRFIPDSMEFKHPPRDVATEAPAGYEGLDFQSRALQLSKVNLSWDEDEPHRMKTLNQKFNADQLAELELKEFLASDESESDDDDDDEANLNKEEKRKQKYRALFESEEVNSDKDEDDNDQDMEVTFNTGLEDLSKHILGKKDKQSETVWESYLRQRREKKRARKNKQNDDSSSDDDDDYHIDRKAMKGNVDDDGDDDFFAEEPPVKKKKEGKTKKKASDEAKMEEVAAEEKSRAELELLLADENAGEGLKGYNIKRKGKKRRTDMAEEKIPAAELNDPRFSALFSSPLYALDPTDPQFKRSATYARQIVQKQKEDPKSSGGYEESKANTTATVKPDGNLGSKKEKYELSSAIKSVKMKIQQKDSEEKQAAKAESSLALSQRVKKKAKALSKNV